jgi:UDP-3-O-[3-hydroxymyristoyl] glucosamine N-acyltransferase
MGLQLGYLADVLQITLRGDAAFEVSRVATLESATADCLSFLSNRKYAHFLASCQAGVVILSERDADVWHGHALIAKDPYLAYAKAAALLHPYIKPSAGIHPTAIVNASAIVSTGVSLASHVTVGAYAFIGQGSIVGAGSVIAEGVLIGRDCHIGPNVTILHDCVLGDRVVVESGTVIGSEGFGWAKEGAAWVKVPQIGRVVIGNDVSIGANCCLDRGAIEDTVISNGVKMDNFIQISHNVFVGEHTAMAGDSGIAGSTRVGARCTFAGKAGVAGHLTIADDVHVTAMTLISHDLHQPGVYSGGTPQDTNANWRRNAARFRQLDDLAKRLRVLEKEILIASGDAERRETD